MTVIILARSHLKAIVEKFPGFAGVIGAKNPAPTDRRPNAVSIYRRDAKPYLAHIGLGKAVDEVCPVVPAIGRFVNAAARTEFIDIPWHTVHLPHRSVDDFGIIGIGSKVGCASLVVYEKNLLPSLAPVLGTENAALFVRSVRVADRGDINQIRVLGIDQDLADLTRIAQADVLPSFARIGRFVDTIAVRNVRAQARFTHSNVNYVRVGFGNRDRTNGTGGEVMIRDVRPSDPGIGCFPYTAAGCPHVIHHTIIDEPGYGRYPPAAIRTDRAPLQRPESL